MQDSHRYRGQQNDVDGVSILFFAVLTVAPFSGFVQVALAPISQNYVAHLRQSAFFAEIMGKYRLSH